MNKKNILTETRRVVTGIEKGESKIIADEKIPAIVPYPIFPSFQLQNLFFTEDNPQSLSTRHLNNPYDINLPEGAMRFLKVRMSTKAEMVAELKNAGQPIPEDWSKFNLHSTDSVDYIYVLSGAITCVVGEQQVNLKAGDFLAQVGPEHTWINDHDEPCYLLCIMMGTKSDGTRKKMMVE